MARMGQTGSIWSNYVFVLLLFGLFFVAFEVGVVGAATKLRSSVSTGKNSHKSNWALLVCSSRFWFNYRHYANTLAMYHSIKRLGIPDSNIILMLADDIACNPRNSFAGTAYVTSDRSGPNLYGSNVEVDFRGYEVTVENFLRVLTDRLPTGTPRSKRLLSDEKSKILVYMSGHGGDEFLKFQDSEEVSSVDLADAFQQMWLKKRYQELLFIIDTCQGNTIFKRFYSPNIIGLGGCGLGEMSYSLTTDRTLGLSTVDRFTHATHKYLHRVKNANSTLTLQDLFRAYKPDEIRANPGIRTDLYQGDWRSVLLTHFFSSVPSVERSPSPVIPEGYDVASLRPKPLDQ